MPIERPNLMSLRLSNEELQLRDLLAKRLGINEAGVMRQALLKLARDEGVELPEKKPHGKPAGAKLAG